MNSPERLRINWGAGNFDNYHIDNIQELVEAEQVPVELIKEAIGYYLKQETLFGLIGFIANTETEVLLKLGEGVDDSFKVSNRTEPYFEGFYQVASEPSPRMTHHGDCLFDLVIIEESK